VAGLALAPESPVWLRWRGRRAAAELAEQRLLGPAWRAAVGEPEEEGALLENGGEVRTPMRVSCWEGVCTSTGLRLRRMAVGTLA